MTEYILILLLNVGTVNVHSSTYSVYGEEQCERVGNNYMSAMKEIGLKKGRYRYTCISLNGNGNFKVGEE